jgi:hypothetical protein
MLRRLLRRSFVVKPPNPTVAESFGTKFTDDQIKKIMDPKGFIEEKEYRDYKGVDAIGKKPEDQTKVEPPKDGKVVEVDNQEYGFRINGPEPTRYGDWERKGRCIDF